MPGWPDYLANSAAALIHLCIVSFNGGRWVQTPGGRFVSAAEARDVKSILLKSVDRQRSATARLAGTDYVIDWELSTATSLRATRTLSASPYNQQEIARVVIVYAYAIVGLATESRENDCADAVRHIADHLRSQTNFSHEEEITCNNSPMHRNISSRPNRQYQLLSAQQQSQQSPSGRTVALAKL